MLRFAFFVLGACALVNGQYYYYQNPQLAPRFNPIQQQGPQYYPNQQQAPRFYPNQQQGPQYYPNQQQGPQYNPDPNLQWSQPPMSYNYDIPQTRQVFNQMRQAIVKLDGPTVNGNVTFTQQVENGEVHVEGTVIGLPPGKYGFHVHDKGDLTGGCLSAGGHFNPDNHQHGAPEDAERHVGDLGNIEFDGNRISRIHIVDRQISLSGRNNILGRAVVLHSAIDDLGRTSHPDSKKTGNAGSRVSCGVIGVLDMPLNNGAGAMSASFIMIATAFMTIAAKFF